MMDACFGGFWRRAAAYGIDKLILQIFSILLLTAGWLIIEVKQPVGWPGEDMALFDSLPGAGVLWSYYFATLLLDMVYFTWFHGSVGQTPGKVLFHLRVVQANGDPMTFGLAFLRWVGYLFSKLVLYLGFFWIAFDREKRGWHDRIAGTIVIVNKKCLDKGGDIL